MIEFNPATGGYTATWNYNDRYTFIVMASTREGCLELLVEEVKKLKRMGYRYEELL